MSTLSPNRHTSAPPSDTATTGTSSWQKAVGIVGVAVLVWVGGDLFDVVTSDGSTPAQGPDGQTPPAGEDHDPSQYDHG